MIKLTAVIPVSLNAERHYLFERALELALFFLRKEVSVIIAEQDSDGDLLAQLTKELPSSIRLVSSPGGKGLSLAQVRNRALKIVNTEWVIFVDADLVFGEDFVDRLTSIVKRPFMQDSSAFLTLPVIYLNRHANVNTMRDISFVKAKYLGDDAIDFIALASSVVLVRTIHVKSVGMYCEDFIGWGFEDHDLALRLIAADSMFVAVRKFNVFDPRPMQEMSLYLGWRAAYRLYGELSGVYGLFALHVWHPTEGSFRSKEYIRKNEALFKRRSRSVKISGDYVPRFSMDSSLYDPYRLSMNIKKYGMKLFMLRESFLRNKSLVNIYKKLRGLHVDSP